MTAKKKEIFVNFVGKKNEKQNKERMGERINRAAKMIAELHGWDLESYFQESEAGQLNDFEFSVYRTYQHLSNPEEGVTPSNKDIAEMLTTDERTISRNAVARARRRIAHKMGYKKGW